MQRNEPEIHHPADLLADVLQEISEAAERLKELRAEADGYIAQITTQPAACR